MIDLTELVPRDLHAGYHWLGKIPNWMRYDRYEQMTVTAAERFCTSIHVNWDALEKAPDHPEKQFMIEAVRVLYRPESLLCVASMESCSRLLADGPKLFVPTSEQFESMGQVEMRMETTEFRSPYPALVVGIPGMCRLRLASQYNQSLNNVPTQVLVRRWVESPTNACVVVMMAMRSLKVNGYFLFHQQVGGRTIEEVITTTVVMSTTGNDKVVSLSALPEQERQQKLMATEMARSAMNCCLMLTHYGYREGGPVDPVAYKKHRTKKHLQHLKFGDFLSVHMKQSIVVRAPAPAANNPPGPGTGIEVRPHWVKGHWCAYPGQGARRAAGEEVPLYFKRPHLRRPDRIVGDLSESEVVYVGS